MLLQKVVVGILQRQDKILVAERPVGKPYSGYWEFPGGKIEDNETGETAIKRELHEELGIEARAVTFCFDHVHEYPDKVVYLEIWFVNDFTGEPHPKENQTLRWLTWQEIEELNILAGNRLILDKIKAINC